MTLTSPVRLPGLLSPPGLLSTAGNQAPAHGSLTSTFDNSFDVQQAILPLVMVKHADPSFGEGYDDDVCNAEVLLTRAGVRENPLERVRAGY